MSLENPSLLWLVALPIAVACFELFRAAPFVGRYFVADRSTLRKVTGATRWRFRAIFFVAVLGTIFLVVATSRPVRHWAVMEEWAEGIDIALVVDISESMEATDFWPNRMEVAKRCLKDFIGRRLHDRIGLVLFGGEAVTKSPLTRDYDFLSRQVDDIRFRELKQGTAIGMGLLGGVTRLRNSVSKNKVIILMTDGDSNVGTVNPITAAKLAREENTKVYTIGIGQNDRVVVPIYSYDAAGRRGPVIAKVPSYLNPELLRRIATMTGGKSYMARDPNMLGRFIDEIDRLEKTKMRVRERRKTLPLFWYPLFAGLGLLALVVFLLEGRFREAHAV